MNRRGKKTTTAIALDELRRRDDLESLRKFLIDEQCFPSMKDPHHAPITMEELKKLVRAWKLNERRNFWKTHAERDDIVSALLQHAEQTYRMVPGNKKNSDSSAHLDTNTNAPAPPGHLTRPIPPSELRPSTMNIRNICGVKAFNREISPAELALNSRHFNFPDKASRVDNVIDRWRSEDFEMKDDSLGYSNGPNGQVNTRNTITASTGGTFTSSTNSGGRPSVVSGIKNKVRIMKQRNLSKHLMNYSAHIDWKKPHNFTVKSVQTFINVAESDDPKTVSNCMIALSNISMDAQVRSILLEINALHRVTNMLQFIRGKQAIWATGLLFYYFSCDKESEDRIYNTSSALLQSNGTLKDTQMILITLYTLNNLMPCIDRLRVTENLMKILYNYFDPTVVFQDKIMTQVYLTVMQNMSWFTNAHYSLLSLNIIELLEKFAKHAITQTSSDIGVAIAKILQSFLQLPEQANNLISASFIQVLNILFTNLDQESTILQALRVCVVLSTIPNSRKLIRHSHLIRTVCNMLIKKPLITNHIAKEAAKFLSNISITNDDKQIMNITASFFVNNTNANNGTNVPAGGNTLTMLKNVKHTGIPENIFEAVFAILKSSNAHVTFKSMAIHSLQNVLSYHYLELLKQYHNDKDTVHKLLLTTIDFMIKFLYNQPDQGAAFVIYNISCISTELCQLLISSKIHIKILELLVMVAEPNLKSAFLLILVQLSKNDQKSIFELIQLDLITKIETQLKYITNITVIKDITLMLLAIVSCAIDSVRENQILSIIHILKDICDGSFCSKNMEIHEEILENCINVLKFISNRYNLFSELDSVLRLVIDINHNKNIIDYISTIIYNMTKNPANLSNMLADITYINVMIRYMRNGQLHIQENIAYAIRTLCSVEKCTELLIKYDILSDLIVIALLRTNSDKIKILCSQAFYNMLCHRKSRLQLLVQGDLWWALMRLGKTDSQQVRDVCIRAIADLTTASPLLIHARKQLIQKSQPVPPLTSQSSFMRASNSNIAAVLPDDSYDLEAFIDENESNPDEIDVKEIVLQRLQALRSHHVLSFLRDLAVSSPPESLKQCLQVTHNLLNQLILVSPEPLTSNSSNQSNLTVRNRLSSNNSSIDMSNQVKSNGDIGSYAHHEILSAIRIGFDAFARSQGNESFQLASMILLKCAQTNVENSNGEFSNIEVIPILNSTKHIWSQDKITCVNITRLLFILGKNKSFTKSTSIGEVNNVLFACYDKSNSLEMCENILSVILQFIVNENISPNEIIKLTIWPIVLKDVLSIKSPFISGGGGKSHLAMANAKRLSLSTASAPERAATGSARGGRQTLVIREASFNANSTPIDVFVDNINGNEPNIFRAQGVAICILAYVVEEMLANKLFDQLPDTVIQGLLKPEFIDSAFVRNNLLVVIHILAQNNNTVLPLLSPDLFRLVMKLLISTTGTNKQDRKMSYAANLLRNFSFHSMYLAKLTSIPHNVVNELVRELCDNITKESAIASIGLELIIFFYQIANYLSHHEQHLTPHFVLEMIQSIINNPVIVGAFNNPANQGTPLISTIENVVNIGKYTITSILNKYPFNHGVDPMFIQNILSYMQQNQGQMIPEIMNQISFSRSSEMECSLFTEFYMNKDVSLMTLNDFLADNKVWKPMLLVIVVSSSELTGLKTPMTPSTVILNFSEANPMLFDKLEYIESLPFIVFNKIVKNFDPIIEGNSSSTEYRQNAISEEGDEEDEDEEDGEDTEDEPAVESVPVQDPFEANQEPEENTDSDEDEHDQENNAEDASPLVTSDKVQPINNFVSNKINYQRSFDEMSESGKALSVKSNGEEAVVSTKSNNNFNESKGSSRSQLNQTISPAENSSKGPTPIGSVKSDMDKLPNIAADTSEPTSIRSIHKASTSNTSLPPANNNNNSNPPSVRNPSTTSLGSKHSHHSSQRSNPELNNTNNQSKVPSLVNLSITNPRDTRGMSEEDYSMNSFEEVSSN